MSQPDRSANGPERRLLRGRRLTDRQTAILEMVSDGLGNKAIASLLGISEQAVKEHVSTLLRLLAAPNRAALGDAAATRRFVGTADIDPDWLRFLFQEAPLRVAVFTGPDLVFVAANKAYQAASGDRALIGRRYRDVFPERGESLALLGRVYATGERSVGVDLPRRFRRAESAVEEDGYVTAVVEPLPGGDGATSGVAVFSMDVTDVVRARRQLRELEAEELAILDQLPSGVIVVDREGYVLKVNQAARQILPHANTSGTAWDLMGLRELATERELPREERPLMRALHGERVPDTELVAIIGTTGQRVAIRASAAPLLDTDGGVRAALVIFTPTARQPGKRSGEPSM